MEDLNVADGPTSRADGQLLQGQAPANAAATTVPREEGNKFQTAISAWRNINLSQLVPTLDETAASLHEQQRDALVDRKDLAQKTKEFRRLDDDAKLVEIKALLKAYQTYIDLISTQSKSASSAFFQVYSPLSEAPDPYPLLEASVESLVLADETLPKLNIEHKALKSHQETLARQLGEAESQLQESRQAYDTLDKAHETKLKEVEQSWSAVLIEKESNWHAREKLLEDKIDGQERLLSELKANLEVSHRLDRGVSAEESVSGNASAAELEMVSSDLDRANLRLAEIEARNEQLCLEIAQMASSRRGTALRVEEEPAYVRLQSENAALLRKSEALQGQFSTEQIAKQSQFQSLSRENANLKSSVADLSTKIASRADYDTIKRELAILKSVEFATLDEDESNEQRLENKSGDENNLEQLLLNRNKKLNDDLTVLRLSRRELEDEARHLREEMSILRNDLQRSRDLVVELENDLARMHSESHDLPAMSISGAQSVRPGTTSSRKPRRASPTSSIISGWEAMPSYSDSVRGDAGNAGILPMVTAQRDRFKKRITELEAELSRYVQLVATLRTEVETLQKDNLNLYEKTRYFSTYDKNQLNSRPTQSFNDDSQSSLARYKTAYESRISPFAAFRGRESARAMKRMSLPERLILQITRLMLSTRTSRNLFATYLVGVHTLLIVMLFWTASGDLERTGTQMSTLMPMDDVGQPPAAG